MMTRRERRAAEHATRKADRKSGFPTPEPPVVVVPAPEPPKPVAPISDAQLAATSAPTNGSAVAAFTNEGGIRTGLAFDSWWIDPQKAARNDEARR